MKKLLVLLLTVAMLATLGVTAFAELGNFLISPSKNKAPELIEGVNESHDCIAELVITPYAERDTLGDEKRAEIEKAYDMIVEEDDLTTFNDDFAKLVSEKNIPTDNLAVSDLFDISYYSCEQHQDHGAFKITLKAETLEGFVALLKMVDGEWVLVEDAVADGDLLTFTVTDLSPFAIVVDGNPPQTGDSFNWWIYVALMVISAASLCVVGYKLKKCED